VSGGDDRRWLISTAPSVERRVLDLALAGAHFAHRMHHGKKEK
jgi:hypothetical protein